MSHPISSSNVMLPPLRTLFPISTFQSSPSSSPLSDEDMAFMPSKLTQPVCGHRSCLPSAQPLLIRQILYEQLYPVPRLLLPFSTPICPLHDHRASITSTASPVPSLTYSPQSQSPAPCHSGSPQRIRLVPCTFQVADVVIVVSARLTSTSLSRRHNPSSASLPYKSSKTGATLLVGSALSCAAKDKRQMHPYRILRERASGVPSVTEIDGRDPSKT